MKIADLERDDDGYVVLPCDSLLRDADSCVLVDHVPYCGTCASQIDHPELTGSES